MKYTTLACRRFAAAALLALLGACGGGGGDQAAAPVDKYLGTWVRCSPAIQGAFLTRAVITKASDTRMVARFSVQSFSNLTCAGTPASTDPDLDSPATFTGTKTIGTEVVDKFETVENGVADKILLVIRSDGKMYVGSTAGARDAEGYPTSIHPDNPYSRQ